ncbi:MAG: hypothetical protein WDN48_05360 [Pseudolabrys sp.]
MSDDIHPTIASRSGALSRDEAFDLDALLHPAAAFSHPSEVVNDPDLTLNEKRAILSSWASDACAVEAAPALRKGPAGRPVQFRRHHGRVAPARQTGKCVRFRPLSSCDEMAAAGAPRLVIG